MKNTPWGSSFRAPPAVLHGNCTPFKQVCTYSIRKTARMRLIVATLHYVMQDTVLL